MIRKWMKRYGLLALSSSVAAVTLVSMAQADTRVQIKRDTLAVRKAFPTRILALLAYGGAPDATITVKKSPEGYYFGHVDSTAATYNSDGGSLYYVVDVTIPANFKFDSTGITPKHISLYGSLKDWQTIGNNETGCPKVSTAWAIYKKGMNAQNQVTWTKVVSETKEGHWVPFVDMGIAPYCDSGVSKLFDIPTPESKDGKPVTYRVMVLPKFNGTAKQATIGWHWEY